MALDDARSSFASGRSGAHSMQCPPGRRGYDTYALVLSTSHAESLPFGHPDVQDYAAECDANTPIRVLCVLLSDFFSATIVQMRLYVNSVDDTWRQPVSNHHGLPFYVVHCGILSLSVCDRSTLYALALPRRRDWPYEVARRQENPPRTHLTALYPPAILSSAEETEWWVQQILSRWHNASFTDVRFV